jgi:hypothetical protein
MLSFSIVLVIEFHKLIHIKIYSTIQIQYVTNSFTLWKLHLFALEIVRRPVIVN